MMSVIIIIITITTTINIITTTTTIIIIITSTWAGGGCRIVLYTWGLPRPNARLRSIQIIIRPMMIYILNKKDGEKLLLFSSLLDLYRE